MMVLVSYYHVQHHTHTPSLPLSSSLLIMTKTMTKTIFYRYYFVHVIHLSSL